MKSIIYVGMDVNKASFTLSCFRYYTGDICYSQDISVRKGH